MGSFEAVGLILAVGDAVAQLLIGIRLGRDADEQVTTVISAAERRLNRVCGTISKYSESADLELLSEPVFQRVIDDLTQIKNELAAFQHRLICMFKVQSFLSSEEMASALATTLERLRPLECFLDLHGVMPYAHSPLAGRFREVTAMVQAAAHSDDFDAVMDKLHQMVSVLQLRGAPNTKLGTATPDKMMDDLEGNSLEAYTAFPEKVRDFTEMLAKSGIPAETRDIICAMVRELWSAWKLQPLDVTMMKKKNGEKAVIGEGAVYKGTLRPRDTNGKPDGEPLLVAVKDLRIRKQELELRLPDVVREIFIQMDMDHPCVLKTYGGYWPESGSAPRASGAESDDEDDEVRYTSPFIVMERMTHNLAKAIRKGMLADIPTQRRVLLDVARAVAHLHENHVVHRDIKPENVLLRVVGDDIVGHAKVSDFGVSRRVQMADFQARHKRAGVALGTFAFMPPEVARDVDNCVSRCSWDVWSFGVLACHVAAPDSCASMRSIQPGRLQKMAESGELVQMMTDIVSKLDDKVVQSVASACLNGDASARPTIAAVVKMLNSDGKSLEDDDESSMPGDAVDSAEAVPLSEEEPQWLGVDGVIPRLSESGVRFYREQAEAGLSNGQRVRDMFYKYGASLVKDMKSAIAVCSAAANAGIPHAKVQLGFMYENGIGVQQDLSLAVKLYRGAANFGNAGGKTHLGECYQLGIGVEKDMARAVRLYTSAAASGSAVARNNLAYCFWNGLGVAKDAAKAAALYSKSASLGFSSAQSNLGYCYLHGIGVPKDKVKALGLWANAASGRDPSGMFNLARCYEYAIGVSEDIAKAICWYTKSGEAGNSSALVNLGCLYLDGRGVEKNVGKSVSLFVKAANAGSAAGRYNLGLCYEKGIGVMQDSAKALRLFARAAESEKPIFMFKLGSCFLEGIGAPKDPKRAVSVFTKAVNTGNHAATNSLGYCYLRGVGVPPDPANAMLLFKAAMDAGNISALSNLGYCYLHGVGVEKDFEKATDLFSSAAAYGDAAGQYNMGYSYLHGKGVEKDTAMAMQLYASAAAGGDAAAQNSLAYCYLLGESVSKDEKRAAHLFGEASESGNVFAQINLANCYLRGIGVEKDAERAVRLYTNAACTGNSFAQNKLGYCYENGLGVAKSLDKAWTLYRAATSAGSVDAKRNLSRVQRLEA